MEYTKQQLNEMQEYVVDELKMHTNHTYPKQERVLNLLLVMVADQRIDTETINKENSEVEDAYEDVILRILVEFEEEMHSAEYAIEKKMKELASQSD